MYMSCPLLVVYSDGTFNIHVLCSYYSTMFLVVNYTRLALQRYGHLGPLVTVQGSRFLVDSGRKFFEIGPMSVRIGQVRPM